MLKLNIFSLKLTKITRSAMYLLAFLISFQTRLILRPGELAGGYFEYATTSLYAADIAVALLVLAIIALLAIKAGKNAFWNLKFKGRNTLLFFAGLFIFSSFISIFAANDKWLSLFRFGWFIEGVFLFLLIVFLNYNILKFFFFLGLGLFVQAGIAVWQFIAQSDFSLKWLGMALHKAEELGVSVIEISNPGELPERWLRAYGALPHPNILGAAMALAALFCLYFLLGRCPAGRIAKYAPIGALTVFFIALLASFSRSAWLGFTAGFAAIFCAVMIARNLPKRKVMLETTLILGLIFFAFFSLYSDLVLTRIKGKGRLEDRSISERVSSSKEAWEIIKSRPFFGVGEGNYALARMEKLEPELSKPRVWDFEPVHNTFLLIWAEMGILGLTAFIGFLAACVYCLLSYLRVEKNNAIFGLAIMAALAIMMNFDHFWMSLHFGVWLSFLVPALALRLSLEG